METIRKYIQLKTGDHQSTISNYLAGRRGLSRDRAKAWANALGIEAGVLLIAPPETVIRMIQLLNPSLDPDHP